METDEQEPVAWMWIGIESGEIHFANSGDPDHNWKPLYTAPPKRQPLSDEAIKAVYYSQLEKYGQLCDMDDIELFARAIEAAHGITNEP